MECRIQTCPSRLRIARTTNGDIVKVEGSITCQGGGHSTELDCEPVKRRPRNGETFHRKFGSFRFVTSLAKTESDVILGHLDSLALRAISVTHVINLTNLAAFREESKFKEAERLIKQFSLYKWGVELYECDEREVE